MTDTPEGRLSAGSGPDEGIDLQREAFVRTVRGLQALLGYDPQQLPPSQLIRPKIGRKARTGLEILLADFSDAPFRINGRGWHIRDNAAALASNFGTYHLGVDITNDATKGAVYACIVLDEIKVFPSGAAGVMEWQYGIENRILRPASSVNHPLETEAPPSIPPNAGTASAPSSRGRINDIVENGGNESAYADGTNFTQVGFLASSAQDVPDSHQPQPGTGRIVIWPGECFVIQALTANVATRFVARGRYVNFGSGIGSGALTT